MTGTTIAIGLGTVGMAGFLIWLAVRSLRKGGEREGRDSVIIQSQKEAIDAVDMGKRLEEAARSGVDPDWNERVRRKYRRD